MDRFEAFVDFFFLLESMFEWRSEFNPNVEFVCKDKFSYEYVHLSSFSRSSIIMYRGISLT